LWLCCGRHRRRRVACLLVEEEQVGVHVAAHRERGVGAFVDPESVGVDDIGVARGEPPVTNPPVEERDARREIIRLGHPDCNVNLRGTSLGHAHEQRHDAVRSGPRGVKEVAAAAIAFGEGRRRRIGPLQKGHMHAATAGRRVNAVDRRLGHAKREGGVRA
jgi:hypothetical protein